MVKIPSDQIKTENVIILSVVLMVILYFTSVELFKNKEFFEELAPVDSPTNTYEITGESLPINDPKRFAYDAAVPPPAANPGTMTAPLLPENNSKLSFPNVSGPDMNKKVSVMDMITEENSPLLAQDKDLTYTQQFDASNKIDTIGESLQLSLNCNSTYSSGSRGFACLNTEGQRLLDTRGGNRGPKPVSGEL